MLITASSVIEAKASGVSTFEPDWMITQPSPELEPTNSPITAPITASEIATLSPMKISGSAHGKRNFAKACHGEADSERDVVTACVPHQNVGV